MWPVSMSPEPLHDRHRKVYEKLPIFKTNNSLG